MTKKAFVFPGQGSQFVGMGQELYESYAEAKAIFDRSDDLLGFSLTGMMFGSGNDPDEETAILKRTENTQPALFVHSIAANAVLTKAGIRPELAGGHSLGEYSALVSAGAIPFEEGLRIVRTRGELMAKAGKRRPGTMAAIIGLDDQTVEGLCAGSSSRDSVVVPANYNSDGQIVISGDVRAVKRAVQRASEAGALKALLLPVSGAFHSPLMEDARAGLAEALAKVSISSPSYPVYSNVTAAPSMNADEIRTTLIEQLTAPVKWSQTLRAMHASGISEFIEVGSGKVLSGLVRRTLGREMITIQAGTKADLDKVIVPTAKSNV